MLRARIPRLGNLVADVWVSERHRRELEVTKNPIEYGSPITDHGFVKARSLSVTFGVTNTPMIENNAFTSNDRVEEARRLLFELQDKIELLTVNTITGGDYENCLITSISWTTDKNSPHSAIFDIDLEEIVIVKTKQTEYEPLPADPRTGDKTSSTKKRGESATKDREAADDTRRNHTADASTDADALAKAAAAKAQADKVAATDNRTLLKKLVDFDFGALL